MLAADLGDAREAVDLTRATADVVGTPTAVGEVDSDVAERWLALALATTVGGPGRNGPRCAHPGV